MDFIIFKNAVAAQFQKMQKAGELYVAMPPVVEGRQDNAKDVMYERYQKAFPQGTNEIFRERPQHDCQCCNSFIRTVGNVVAFIDGKVETIWDIEIPDQPMYQIVANAMAKLVKRWTVGDKFRHYSTHAGTDRTPEEIDGKTHYWDHFYAEIDKRFVMPEDKMGPYLNEWRSNRDVLLRGMETITVDAVDTVIDLLANGSLYRGDEKESNLLKFRDLIVQYDAIKTEEGVLPWLLPTVDMVHPSIAKMRNSAMGKLLVAITDEEDLEEAVKAYEHKMAPENYKRTSAVVTPAMKKKAQQFVEENDLESALVRRHAKPTDITVNNVLWANRKAKSQIEGSVFDALETKSAKPDFSKVEEVPVAQFLSKILPKAESLEVFVENSHFGKLMSLTAPVHADAKPILQWDNNFCWSYKGEVTDSIKERVKAAGGVVDADLCFRLAWSNLDDLDLYVVEPNGFQICFSDKISQRTGGQLDVDANSPYSTHTRTPVENIFYKDKRKMQEGVYTVAVNQYQNREKDNIGFQLDMDFGGNVTHFAYDKPQRAREFVTVLKFKYTHANGVEIISSLPHSQSSSTEWGVTSQKWTPVNMVMLSPNHWDDNECGNKHWFFILDECKNPEPVRGFYNEFLKSKFHEHRKTFEVLASKIKAPYSDEQMSGLGFSSTQRAHLMCKVSGSFNRVIKIVF